MELTGEYRIPAPREKVWQALNDPNVLQRCIPGCESVEKLSDTEFTAKVVLKIGPMTAKFSGKGTLSDLDPPNGYTITGEGQGGVAGFGKGSAKVRLEADGPATTIMRYTAETQVGGKMAQLGARLIDSTSKKLADQFFDRFAAALSGPVPASTAPGAMPSPEEVPEMAGAAPVPPPAASAVAAGSAPDGQRLKPAVWIPVVVAIVAVVLWWFSRS
jgi:carbon monoxide dehydrogenase subunit G